MTKAVEESSNEDSPRNYRPISNRIKDESMFSHQLNMTSTQDRFSVK